MDPEKELQSPKLFSGWRQAFQQSQQSKILNQQLYNIVQIANIKKLKDKTHKRTFTFY